MILIMTPKIRITAQRYRLLRQGVTLTGLQTPTFMKAVEAVQDIHSHFDQQFQEGTLEEHAPEEVDQLSMWNRYFTPARKAKDMRAIAFLPGVDPVGILRGMGQEDSNYAYIHTEDNQVHYYITHWGTYAIICQ